MIIVEGPNRAGKSTLCKMLRNEWSMKPLYIRDYAHRDNVWYSSLTAVESQGYIALDRCWLTEVIYHKPCRLRLDQLYYLALLTEATSGFMIVLLPPEIELAKREGKLNSRSPGSSYTLSEIWNRYNLLCRNRLFIDTIDGYKLRADTLLPSKVIYWTQPELKVSHLTLIREGYKKTMMARTTYKSIKLAGVGSMDPKILLLADKVNPKVSKDPKQIPLMPIHQSHAGAYLMRVLYWSGVDLKTIHLHNAFKPNDVHYSRKLLDFLYPFFVIALGDRAHEAARTYYHKDSYKLSKFPHPQYLRRFHSGMEKTYGRKFRDDVRKLGGLAKLFSKRKVSS